MEELDKIIAGLKATCAIQAIKPSDDMILDGAVRIYNTRLIQESKHPIVEASKIPAGEEMEIKAVSTKTGSIMIGEEWYPCSEPVKKFLKNLKKGPAKVTINEGTITFVKNV